MYILTQSPMIANLCLPLPHVAVATLTPRIGQKRPLSTVVFFHPSKSNAALIRVFYTMMGFVEQPFKRLACSYTGSENLINSIAQRLSLMGGGYPLFIGSHHE